MTLLHRVYPAGKEIYEGAAPAEAGAGDQVLDVDCGLGHEVRHLAHH